MKEFNIEKSRKAQQDYVNREKCPDFSPSTGICFSCKQNIYSEINHGDYSTGIDVETAGKELIIGCPHCNRSYCD